MGKKGAAEKKGGLPPPSAVAQDPRFAAALTDARFQRFPKKRQTVAIDERFKGEPLFFPVAGIEPHANWACCSRNLL